MTGTTKTQGRPPASTRLPATTTRRRPPVFLDCGICGQRSMRLMMLLTGDPPHAPVPMCQFCDAEALSRLARAA